MIKQEYITIDNKTLVKTYSDNKKYIIQLETGIEYTEAIDVPNRYNYIESVVDIPKEIKILQ